MQYVYGVGFAALVAVAYILTRLSDAYGDKKVLLTLGGLLLLVFVMYMG